MANIFKSLSPADYSIVPFPAYYKYSYTYVSGSTSNSSDVQVSYGEKYVPSSATGIRVANNKHELFDSVVQAFYSDIPRSAYGITPIAFIPEDSVYVIGVTQDVFGEKILPGSFTVLFNTSQSYDDGKGNLIASSSAGSGSYVGRIFYDKGIAVIKSAGYTNINVDEEWSGSYLSASVTANGGYQFVKNVKLTSALGSTDGVYHGYPKTETYAAKIATRTSVHVQDTPLYGFSYTPVTAGDGYRISIWAYANGTTWRGIQNGGVEGSDYPLGFYIQFLDSSFSLVSDEIVRTETGPIGWKLLAKDFTIPSGVSYILVGPFIDGPYPAGFGYGTPVCSEEDTLKGCPGYAWFANLKVEKISPAGFKIPGGGLDNRGMQMLNASSLGIQFSSSVTLYENVFKAKIEPTDFLYATNNPSAKNAISGSTATPTELMVSGTLEPYVTTIGFYNDKNELLLVGKPSVPIKRTRDLTQTFIVKFDV